jgi:hypothetical protein
VKVGDMVRLTGIPPNLRDDDDFKTRTLFEKCLGHTFPIISLETVEGLPFQLVKLNVGHIVGEPDYMQTVWVEPEYLQVDPE